MLVESISATLPMLRVMIGLTILEVLLGSQNIHSGLRNYRFYYIIQRYGHLYCYLQVHPDIDAQ